MTLTPGDIMRITPELVDAAVHERNQFIRPGDSPKFSGVLYNSPRFMAIARELAGIFGLTDEEREGVATVAAAMTMGIQIGHQIAIEQMREHAQP